MTHFVSPYGSDRNPGTRDAPFATIQAGVDAAQPGDTITVLSGMYTSDGFYAVDINKAGTQGNPITLTASGSVVLDGRGVCHSFINFNRGAAWWIVQGFTIRDSYNGQLWANSGGAQNIVISGNDISGGTGGLYTDEAAAMLVDGNVFHDFGRPPETMTNSFDQGVYSHGQMTIMNNRFYNARSGWFIQTASGFSGTIKGNTFTGKNQYPGKDGQIMLWDTDGPIDIAGNNFVDPQGPAIVDFDFSSPRLTITGNQVSGAGSVGGPDWAIRDSGAPAPMPQVDAQPIYQAFASQIAPQFLGPPVQAPAPASPMPLGAMLAIGAVAVLLILAD